ncbi:hypothetical protein LEP1GSC191_2370 [Leptospira borgpetersenii serovar Mini str. 201000851]|uniref:Uncharacterized protein n=1 Tax=Leptospira borgpetersenii str. 200801926 TaxID=1193009 RepID=A0ABN0HX58_LEPBO|nr:hypothetical protein LEP1GSC128_3759 [Leptospira borgpetersenii str. 200801926]ENO65146.1 hypothetical protein LEP1GSC191_2370 [Leptospira borgpetersenii serovar Mini str. 201000851]
MKLVILKQKIQKKIGIKSFNVALGFDSVKFDRNHRRIVNEIKKILKFKLIPV